jgi:hypothetical protein
MEHAHSKLAQFRDELKLQIHLFKADAMDEWHGLEKKWRDFTHEVDRLAEATDDSDANTNAFARELMDDIEAGYNELTAALKDPLA